MEEQKEQAICHRYSSYLAPMLGFGRWQEKTIERLKLRERFFSRELSKEGDFKKRNYLQKALNETRSELRKLFLSWKRSAFRTGLIQRRETGFVMRQDKLLMAALHTESDIERKYQEAGRIINRNRPAKV